MLLILLSVSQTSTLHKLFIFSQQTALSWLSLVDFSQNCLLIEFCLSVLLSIDQSALFDFVFVAFEGLAFIDFCDFNLAVVLLLFVVFFV